MEIENDFDSLMNKKGVGENLKKKTRKRLGGIMLVMGPFNWCKKRNK